MRMRKDIANLWCKRWFPADGDGGRCVYCGWYHPVIDPGDLEVDTPIVVDCEECGRVFRVGHKGCDLTPQMWD